MSIINYLGLLAIWMVAAILTALLIAELICARKGKSYDKQDKTP